MNYLKSLFLTGCVLVALMMSAGEVGVRDAQAKALRFINQHSGSLLAMPQQDLRLDHVEPSREGLADYYVFNAKDGSAFVIVSGDDQAREVLAYGSKSLNMDAVPCNMRWLLDHYKRQMALLREHPEILASGRSERAGQITVSPLVSCTWSQSSPFYNQCPTSGTQHCLTGCVATAMAQVMYYWKYPAVAPAMDAYTSDINGVSVDALPGGEFDWDNMLDVYSSSATTQQTNAVAMLMRYCGQASRMGYGTSGSGANSIDELAGMKLFGYNADATLLDRDDYSADEWAAMIEAQLAAGCPILYGGMDADKNIGHAFVVDGCGGGMYHVNWGYSGSGNGYFALDAFTVMGYKYSSEQQMLYQVYPSGYMYGKCAAVMQEAGNVGSISFQAIWTDETPNGYVTDYTLYVQPYDPSAHDVVLNETFGGVDVNVDATTALSSNKVGTYCDNAGWTGSFIYLGAGGCFIVGGQKYVGSLTTPALTIGDSDAMTVRFTSRYFGSDNSSVIVTCGDVQQTVELTRTATEYSLVFEQVEDGATVTFGCTGRAKRFYIDDVVVTIGDDRDPIELGAQGTGCFVFPDITTNDYTVTGLTPGGTYRYLVVTRFADGTTKKSNSRVVTLADEPQHAYAPGDVNHDGEVTIKDVTMLIDYLLGAQQGVCPVCADVNADQSVTIKDVTLLIDYLLAPRQGI
ncbi:MAG: C10 family peptidase [Muribaculaceae bacterium]|nr:C10 family peptidase [Muribaculaceae bacterium]